MQKTCDFEDSGKRNFRTTVFFRAERISPLMLFKLYIKYFLYTQIESFVL